MGRGRRLLRRRHRVLGRLLPDDLAHQPHDGKGGIQGYGTPDLEGVQAIHLNGGGADPDRGLRVQLREGEPILSRQGGGGVLGHQPSSAQKAAEAREGGADDLAQALLSRIQIKVAGLIRQFLALPAHHQVREHQGPPLLDDERQGDIVKPPAGRAKDKGRLGKFLQEVLLGQDLGALQGRIDVLARQHAENAVFGI